MNIRTRILILLSSTFFGLILVFGVAVYELVSDYAFQDFYQRLMTRCAATASIQLDHETKAQLIHHFKREYIQPLPEEKDVLIPWKEMEKLRHTADKYQVPYRLLYKLQDSKQVTFRKKNTMYGAIHYVSREKGEFAVITSAKNYYYKRYISYLGSLLGILVLVAALLIFVLSLWLSKRLIQPLQKITRKVQEIGSENLNVRLNGAELDDEMGELIRTINYMLDRLETSFETQNNFISNASHELNTPLTAIIGQADVALVRPRNVQEYVETLHNILVEAEKLSQKTKALLYLAQTGFNGKKLVFDTIRLDELLFETIEMVSRIDANNKVKLDIYSFPENYEQMTIRGNEKLLQLALSNVILNGCKYSGQQPVSVQLSYQKEEVCITITDRGIGIPVDELHYIYDPFFRASNTSNFEGYGIGLPLTRNIIRLHEGRLVVTSSEGKGTKVELFFPVNYCENK